MNEHCRVNKLNGQLYQCNVMGPYRYAYLVLCGTCQKDRACSEKITILEKTESDVCGDCGKAPDNNYSDTISEEGRKAAEGWGWASNVKTYT